MFQLWHSFSVALRHDNEKMRDKRICEFCLEYGDGDSNGSGRWACYSVIYFNLLLKLLHGLDVFTGLVLARLALPLDLLCF